MRRIILSMVVLVLCLPIFAQNGDVVVKLTGINMKAVKKTTKTLPFVAIIVLNLFAQAGGFRLELLKPFALIIAAVLGINLTIALFLKVKDYFIFGLIVIALIGIMSIFIFPLLGQLYAENVIVGLYLGLFIVAAFPPLFKIKPFTFQFSENDYPEVVTVGEQFLRINLIINYILAVLFVLLQNKAGKVSQFK